MRKTITIRITYLMEQDWQASFPQEALDGVLWDANVTGIRVEHATVTVEPEGAEEHE